MDCFKDRLQAAISDYSVNAFAKKSGVTEGTLRTYLSGASLPGLDKLIAISNAAEVNIEWLAVGNGPMRKIDRMVFSPSLLTLIIDVLDDHEIKLGKKLTATEKADFIETAYELCFDADPDSPQTKTLIQNTIKEAHNLLSSLDQMIKTKEGRVRAKRIIRREFEKVLSKEEAEREANEFIDSRLLARTIK